MCNDDILNNTNSALELLQRAQSPQGAVAMATGMRRRLAAGGFNVESRVSGLSG